MSNPAYWEKVRRKALEAANQPGATAKDRQRALEVARNAEQRLHGQQRAPDAPAKEVEDDAEKTLAVEKA